jgi:biotin carboxylase
VAHVLLLLPTTSYRTGDFLRAAASLGVEVVVGCEEPSTLERLNPSGLLTLDFRDPAACARAVGERARLLPIDAVVGVDEDTAVAAAAIAEALGLPHNPIEAVEAARHKGRMRERLARAGAPSPAFRVFFLEEDAARVARSVAYPCVLKPTFLAASRGVIRANRPEEFEAAWKRIAGILAEPDVAQRGGAAAREILVEDFVPGAEVALEGLLRRGLLRTLALFDKPDPLVGPYFEETIYVTPSRLPAAAQVAIREAAELSARALGLIDGPVHAELRWNERGPWIVEIAARSIGGLCARTLRFGTGMFLEELILRHALGLEVPAAPADARAAGVMMIPIPAAGTLEEVLGLEEACAVEDIEGITISAHPGQRLVPLPEGSRYLGFIFSRAETPAAAEVALREAHRRLEFRVRS